MKEGCKVAFLLTFVLAVGMFNSMFIFAEQNETMAVEINLISNQASQMISIEVPDHVFLGNVTKGDKTDKHRVDVNNTGNVDIIITPLLKETSDGIFSNLYFQSKQSNSSPISNIGEYSFNISKPSTQGGKRSEYCWMWLDLTDYQEDIEEDRIGLTGDVIFVALPK